MSYTKSMKLTAEDISYPLQNGGWVPAIQYYIDYGYKVDIRHYAWYNRHFQTREEASSYALRAGHIFAKKLGLIN